MAQNNGIKEVGKGVADLAKAGVTVATTAASTLGSLGRSGGGAANGVLGFTGRLLSGAASVITKHPKVSMVVGVYAGLKGIQHIVRKNKEKQAMAQQEGGVAAAGPESYDPRAFATAEPQPVSAVTPAEPPMAQPEQDALLQELLQAQAAQQAPHAQQGADDRWQQKIRDERAQQGPSSPQL
jgi:hypothetical protein